MAKITHSSISITWISSRWRHSPQAIEPNKVVTKVSHREASQSYW